MFRISRLYDPRPAGVGRNGRCPAHGLYIVLVLLFLTGTEARASIIRVEAYPDSPGVDYTDDLICFEPEVLPLTGITDNSAPLRTEPELIIFPVTILDKGVPYSGNNQDFLRVGFDRAAFTRRRFGGISFLSGR